jgi:hypothetical protein
VEPIRADADGERGRGLVRVDVERAARERRDNGYEPRLERTGLPTSPSSGSCTAGRPISSPASGSARSPIAAQTAAFTWAKLSCTTASASGVVTRRPPTKRTSSPRRSISAEICGPAPCTTQTRSPSTRTASATPAVDAPPTFSTTVTCGTPR